MQVSVEATEGLTRKMTVAVPAEQIDTEVKKRINDTAKKARIDGFRPGKVPVKVVKQRFGESLRNEVVGEFASQSFQQAIAQEKLRPVSQPSIEPTNNVEGEDFQFVATFEVYPEVELGDVSQYKIERLVVEVQDSEVEGMIAKLRDQQASWDKVDRVAADGDQVNIDFEGTKGGESFDGGSANDTALILGSNSMIEGFETGLIGTKADEEKVLALTFPEDYASVDLQGQAVEFQVKVNSVSQKTLPELDKEFFSKFEVGEDLDLDGFKGRVKENMDKQLEDAKEAYLKKQVMDALVDNHDIEIPAAMIAGEIDNLRRQSLSQFGQAAESFDLSLLPDELFTENAQRRVSLGVILGKAIEHFEIQPERENVIEFIDEIASSYDDPEEVRNQYLGDESMMQQVQTMVIERMVVEKLTEQAQLSDLSCSYDEAIAKASSSPDN